MLKGMCDSCGLDRTEQPLQNLLNSVLTRPFGLKNGSCELTDLLPKYMDEIEQESDLLSAWQRLSFYEWLIPRFQEQESESVGTAKDLFAALFRSNKVVSHAAIDIGNFSPMSGEKIHLPPVRIPLIPLAYRFSHGQKTADEVTIVSWIPGLAQAIKQPYWSALNRFFGARKVHCVWCDPEPIRSFLSRNADRMMIIPRLPE